MPDLRALSRAAVSGDVETIARYLKEGGDPNINEAGTTLLQEAAWVKQDQVVKLLLEAGADVNMASVHQETALSKAITYPRQGLPPMVSRGNLVHQAPLDVDRDRRLRRRVVQLLLDAGADVNLPRQEGEITRGADLSYHSALGHAAREGDPWIVELLLARGAKLEARSYTETTPLWEAACAGNVEAVQVLLDAGADANARSASGQTPLVTAVYGPGRQVGAASAEERNRLRLWFLHIVEALLKAGADVNLGDDRGFNALWACISEGHPDLLALILGAGADLNHRDEAGEPVLCFLVKRQQLRKLNEANMARLARTLLNAGADPDARNRAGETARELALGQGAEDLAAALGGGLLPCDQELFRETVSRGEAHAVLAMLEAGCDPNAVMDERQRTPLHLASMWGKDETVELLLEHGADVTARDSGDACPLHLAAAAGHKKVVGWLLARGADVTARNGRGMTPLHLAASSGHGSLVARFLAGGADPNAVSEYGGWTPLHMVGKNAWLEEEREERFLGITRVLLKAGADPAALDQEGMTALDHARKEGPEALVTMLEKPTSGDPILEACIAFFEADEWPYERVEELPMVRSRYSGRNGHYDCWFQVRPDEKQLMFYTRAPVNAAENSRMSVAEFFTRANYGMVVGNFELDMSDGEMRYKVSVDAEGIELTPAFLKNFSYTSVVTMDRYLQGIMKVLAGLDPVQVIKEVEG